MSRAAVARGGKSKEPSESIAGEGGIGAEAEKRPSCSLPTPLHVAGITGINEKLGAGALLPLQGYFFLDAASGLLAGHTLSNKNIAAVPGLTSSMLLKLSCCMKLPTRSFLLNMNN